MVRGVWLRPTALKPTRKGLWTVCVDLLVDGGFRVVLVSIVAEGLWFEECITGYKVYDLDALDGIGAGCIHGTLHGD